MLQNVQGSNPCVSSARAWGCSSGAECLLRSGGPSARVRLFFSTSRALGGPPPRCVARVRSARGHAHPMTWNACPCPHPAADPSARLNVRSPRAARSQGVLLRARAQRSLVAAGRRQWPGAYAAGAWVVQQDGRLASGPAGRAARQPALRHRLLRAAAWPAVRCRAPAATGRPLSPLSPSPLPPHSHPS